MSKTNWVVGISGLGNRFHDNSIALVKNGELVFAASEERYSRAKHDASFPLRALQDAFQRFHLTDADITMYSSGWPPFAIGRLIRELPSVSFLRFLTGMLPYQSKHSLQATMSLITKGSLKKTEYLVPMQKHQFFDHHLAHAASAYRTSGLRRCLAVVWDGFGTKSNGMLASGGVYTCFDGAIKEISVHTLQTSLGLFYEAVTNALGFSPAEGEGKTMGLASYGDPKRFLSKVAQFAPHFVNGQWHSSPYWMDTLAAVDLAYKPIFSTTYLGRTLEKLASSYAKDIAASCQHILEEQAVAFFLYLHKTYGYKDFVFAGGVFLNIKMMQKIRELPFVNSVYVHPNAGDGGLAVGAALQAYHSLVPAQTRKSFVLESVALGSDFSDQQILRVLQNNKGITFRKVSSIPEYTAEQLVKGKVIGWFQGKAEWGPRALGRRSVLADPRDTKMRERINNYLKKREWFMPFAPSILEEKVAQYLDHAFYSPFMTVAFEATKKAKKEISAAVHVDGTCRPQIVRKSENILYWKTISAFEKLTGVSAVLNTSFNKHGLPIVQTPQDAIDHLLWKAVDELMIGSFVVKRV